MYLLQPLQAWERFRQASSTYAIYLRGQAAYENCRGEDRHLSSSSDGHLEQSIYWTCFKSEWSVDSNDPADQGLTFPVGKQ